MLSSVALFNDIKMVFNAVDGAGPRNLRKTETAHGRQLPDLAVLFSAAQKFTGGVGSRPRMLWGTGESWFERCLSGPLSLTVFM